MPGSLLVDSCQCRPRLSGSQLQMLRGQTDQMDRPRGGHMIMAAHPNILPW